MVNVDVVARKTAVATARLAHAEALFASERESVTANEERRDLASFYVFLAIQECIDLAAHWVAERAWDPSDDAGSAFQVLASRGAVDAGLAERMRDAVGLRKRIAHGYAMVDHARLFDELRAGADALRQFLRAVADEAGI